MDVTVPPLSERAMTEAFERLDRNRHGRLEGLALWLCGVQDAVPPKPLERRRVVVFDDAWNDRAYDDGVALADREADEGADVAVVVSPPTIGAVTIVAALTNAEPVEVVANGPHWKQQVADVRDALRTHKAAEPMDLATHLGKPALVGFLVGAAKRRTPVVLDGVAPAAAALVARAVAPLCVSYFAAGHVAPGPAHRRALEALGLVPLLDLGIRTDGAASLALPLLDAAVGLFDESG